ncbi:hypothetical protein [Psittacicella gerlachiana]|uniref:Uncharacterized protein n=1 Tax=Psittacicella gerlachiana TaxID=2028574 RepID=A0A3A1Y971_9GAMM|nr:hypothetical protein [Psittacicella gerlachiana]RIY34732.1 hypothetical protein CKF59_04915 [Psittacicella gerlachiana]
MQTLENLASNPLATALFVILWLLRLRLNLSQKKFSFDRQMFSLAAIISFIIYLGASHIFSLSQGAYNHTLLIMLAFAGLNILYLFFTKSNRVIDYAQKHKQLLFSRKSIIFYSVSEAIITLYIFLAYMHVPQGFVLGLHVSLLEIITNNNSIGMLILAIVACRFFYVLTLGTYRILAFWLTFICCLSLCGGIFGIIYYYSVYQEHYAEPIGYFWFLAPYAPSIVYFSLLTTLKLIHNLLVKNDKKEISFSAVIPYVLRTLAGLLEPLCLSIIIYFFIIYFTGVETLYLE